MKLPVCVAMSGVTLRCSHHTKAEWRNKSLNQVCGKTFYVTFAASVYLRAHLSTTESSGKGTQIVGHLFIKSLTCETALTEHSRKNKK